MLSKMTDPSIANYIKSLNCRVDFIQKFIEKVINKATHAKISLSDIFQIISINISLENIQKRRNFSFSAILVGTGQN